MGLVPLTPARRGGDAVAVPPSCRIPVKAIPNAPRSGIAGWMGDALKVRISAPALDGRANEALCGFLADALGLPGKAVTLVQGGKSRRKLVEIRGLDASEVRARLKP